MEEKVILILHGWGSSSQKWVPVKSYLESRGLKVYVPDLPGFGESPPPKYAWSIDNYVEWARTYCEKQNISASLAKQGEAGDDTKCQRPQIFLLGHSFGGSIAAKFALKYPEKIKKLFLVAPALVRVKTLKKKIINKTAKFFSFLPSSAKKIIYGKVLKSDYPLTAGTMRNIFQKVIGEDVSPRLSEIKVPTIIIWGQNDNVTPIKDAYLVHKRINGSKLIIIENQNHDINRKAPELLAEKVLENVK